MADDDTKPAPPPLPPAIEAWSSLSQGDLGLKAVFWTDDSKTAITSREIAGWITYDSRRVTDVFPVQHGFAAIVISDWWMPVLASGLPRYACVAPKDVPDEEIMRRAREWSGAPNPPPKNVN